MKVIVTGHTGFIGRHLCRSLADFDLVGISDSVANDSAVQQIALDLTVANLRTFKQHTELLSGSGAVVHLAGYRPVVQTEAADDLERNMRMNALGTLNVLMMAKELGIRKVILASSKSVYGRRALPSTEDDKPAPDTNYGRSKLLAEQLCKEFAELYNMSCTSLRISSVYGPGMTCNLVFAEFLNKALKAEPLLVREYLSGFEPLDILYMKDLTAAIEIVLRREQIEPFEAINIGSGNPVNTIQLARDIVSFVGSLSEVRVIKTQESRLPSVLDSDRAKKVLSWVPRYSVESAIKDFLPSWRCENKARG